MSHPYLVNSRNMTITIDDENGEPRVYPAKAEVCPQCHGKGSTVNPAIDGNGLGAEDFAEDPDFAEAYVSGAYDVICCCCGGCRIVLTPATAEGDAELQRVMRDEREQDALQAAERRAGC